ncbi:MULTISPECIES: EVE domain-containing protein [unclassified Plantibacter]|jgi:hypothetical protein|uniref:EVE domain-containing protein n=1 Tax=unclassified Plantibacter TaxID=2624265 RepID=UPI003D35236A
MAIRYWLGVVHRDHALIGMRQGYAQINHGNRGGLERMHESDGIVYYSPRVSTPDGEPLRAFTAIGRIADDTVYQAETGTMSGQDWKPWRRRVDYFPDAREAPIRPLRSLLDFTSLDPNWGYQLRRGLIELSRHDFDLIRNEMRPRHPEEREYPEDRRDR